MINEIQPDASSTSELITLMIGRERITRQIAEPLYMGIAHDTGVFQYSCTSSRTMMTGGWLIDTGIDFSRICDETFFLKSYHQNQILGRALTESILMMDGKLIFAAIRRKDMDFYQVQPKDLDGIVQQLRITRGVECAVFLYETGPGEFKVSLRSNGSVNVAGIAVYFQGGGHVRAAGCTMCGSVHDVVNNIAAQVEKQLEKKKNPDPEEAKSTEKTDSCGTEYGMCLRSPDLRAMTLWLSFALSFIRKGSAMPAHWIRKRQAFFRSCSDRPHGFPGISWSTRRPTARFSFWGLKPIRRI